MKDGTFYPKYLDKTALIVELKWEKNAETAISQIEKQNYPDVLNHYIGNILLVGINYSKKLKGGNREYKHYSCRIRQV